MNDVSKTTKDIRLIDETISVAPAEWPETYKKRIELIPLCAEYLTPVSCHGCPVYEKTGWHGCAGTPVEMPVACAQSLKMRQYLSILKTRLEFERKESV